MNKIDNLKTQEEFWNGCFDVIIIDEAHRSVLPKGKLFFGGISMQFCWIVTQKKSYTIRTICFRLKMTIRHLLMS
jgi:hypothetical protein